MPALLTPVDTAGLPPPSMERGGPVNDVSAPSPVEVAAAPREDAESALKSRVAMLREKLLQKRQEQDGLPGPAPGGEEPTGPKMSALEGKEPRDASSSLVDSFLAEDSNRHALQALAEDLAKKRGGSGKDMLGPPPEVDIPRAQMGDEMLDDFMSRSRVGLGAKGPAEARVNGTRGATVADDEVEAPARDKKAKRKKKHREKPPTPDNVFLPQEPCEAQEPVASAEVEGAAAERQGTGHAAAAEPQGKVEVRLKKRKKDKEKAKKERAKRDESEDPKRFKKVAERPKRVELKPRRECIDPKKARKRKKESSSSSSSTSSTNDSDAVDNESSEPPSSGARRAEEKKAKRHKVGRSDAAKAVERKTQERKARQRHAEETAKHKDRKAKEHKERGRERREQSARLAERQDRSRHKSCSRRRSESPTREQSQRHRLGGRSHGHSRSHSHGCSRRHGRGSRSRRRGHVGGSSRGDGGRRSHSGRRRPLSSESSSVGSSGRRGSRSASSGRGCGKEISNGEYKPYSRVVLHGLQVNTDLNGLCGIVAPPGLPQSGDMTGTYKVRLETAREVGVKPANLQPARRKLSPSRERRLRMVLEQMKAA